MIKSKRQSTSVIDKTLSPVEVEIESHQNSFLTIFQPRRISIDLRLFLQMYRKKVRCSEIEKQFRKNNEINFCPLNQMKGFKGHKRKFYQSSKQAKIFSFEKDLKQYNNLISQEQKKEKQPCENQKNTHKLNFMYNLNLYRKNKESKIMRKKQGSEDRKLEKNNTEFKRKNYTCSLANTRFHHNKILISRQKSSSQTLYKRAGV